MTQCFSFGIRHATPADWPAIAALLRHYDLPLDGALEHLAHFRVAFDPSGQIVGVAGIEHYGDSGLLRSVAVIRPGEGVGGMLVEDVIHEATDAGMHQLILLTTTAADYFLRLGFRCAMRDEAPPAVRQSAEFLGACPDTAQLMILDL